MSQTLCPKRNRSAAFRLRCPAQREPDLVRGLVTGGSATGALQVYSDHAVLFRCPALTQDDRILALRFGQDKIPMLHLT